MSCASRKSPTLGLVRAKSRVELCLNCNEVRAAKEKNGSLIVRDVSRAGHNVPVLRARIAVATFPRMLEVGCLYAGGAVSTVGTIGSLIALSLYDGSQATRRRDSRATSPTRTRVAIAARPDALRVDRLQRARLELVLAEDLCRLSELVASGRLVSNYERTKDIQPYAKPT